MGNLLHTIKHKYTTFTSSRGYKHIANLFYIPAEVHQINRFYIWVASFFGSGFFKYASGTFASIIAAILGLILISFSHYVLLTVLAILIIAGFVSAEKAATDTQRDPNYIVIDEVVGQLIPFLLIRTPSFVSNLFMAFLALVIFRILDIYKPWIIGRAERTFRGGIGIMLDDILAGVFTLFIIFIIALFL